MLKIKHETCSTDIRLIVETVHVAPGAKHVIMKMDRKSRLKASKLYNIRLWKDTKRCARLIVNKRHVKTRISYVSLLLKPVPVHEIKSGV